MSVGAGRIVRANPSPTCTYFNGLVQTDEARGYYAPFCLIQSLLSKMSLFEKFQKRVSQTNR